ncbi:radical SAM protein [Clostridium sp.]|uniref:radical SAM protein n=1 Tax=Clostridium sp. TaxID=1506 RepID=UPI0025BC5263|nr:radical SAM protein [Clostridium sp.]
MQEILEYKSFYRKVVGGEGSRCNYSTRLDVYGCGCQHDCSYCFSKSLLNFRKHWNSEQPKVADISKVRKRISLLPNDICVRLGGMTDCFMPMEKQIRNSYNAIKELNSHKKHYLIVTKSHLIADDEYIAILDKKLAHIQISVTSTDDKFSQTYEKASVPSKRIEAIEKLYSLGFDVQLRLSPFIPKFIDFNLINDVKCDKILVEFLRINTWIQKWFDIDYSEYTIISGGYKHLPLEKKIDYLSNIVGFKEISVCEDVEEHYRYWKNSINYNPDDCCNLRL